MRLQCTASSQDLRPAPTTGQKSANLWVSTLSKEVSEPVQAAGIAMNSWKTVRQNAAFVKVAQFALDRGGNRPVPFLLEKETPKNQQTNLSQDLKDPLGITLSFHYRSNKRLIG